MRETYEERDYSEIRCIDDEEAYLEIRNRDENWTEAKAALEAKIDGGGKSVLNSNLEPLGKACIMNLGCIYYYCYICVCFHHDIFFPLKGERNSFSARGVKREVSGVVKKSTEQEGSFSSPARYCINYDK